MDAANISEKDRMLKEKEAEVFSNLIYCFAQCKGILDCLGFWIPLGIQVLFSGFQSLVGFRIP